MALYVPHSRALSVLYADVENHALGQSQVLVGTPGSVVVRSNASGFRFYAHQHYDGLGARREAYLAGPVGGHDAELAANALRRQIAEANSIVPSLRLLGREGFALADARTYATVASLHNHEVFVAGGLLVGSHAYGALLNRLGARCAPYATQDIDIARRKTLAFGRPPAGSFLTMLRDSGVDFVEVPSFERKQPSTSFKQPGRSSFRVDLLVPSPNDGYPVVAVPELGAHAIGLPYLDYLLAEAQPGVLMARHGCCSVRLPLPERFAIHKLIVSRLRTGRDAKSEKDVYQACVLCAVLADTHPGAVGSAAASVPRRAKKHLKAALTLAGRFLEQGHPRALEELQAASASGQLDHD